MQMKMNVESDSLIGGKPKEAAPSAAPPPPPRFWAAKTNADSVTNQEISDFWRRKSIVEEDHLLAAIKDAARIRARYLTEEDYMRFSQSLIDDDSNYIGIAKEKLAPTTDNSQRDENNWWRKSKYAYLNQPPAV